MRPMQQLRLLAWLLLLAALVVWICSWYDYYPIGYFKRRWLYLLTTVLWLYLARDVLCRLGQQLVVRILAGLATIWAFGFLPAIFVTTFGCEHETLYEDGRYCLAVTSEIITSGGQSNYSIFENF